jgi:hypothetical protein
VWTFGCRVNKFTSPVLPLHHITTFCNDEVAYNFYSIWLYVAMRATCSRPKLPHKQSLQKETLDGITIWSPACSAKMRKVVFSCINFLFGHNYHWDFHPKIQFQHTFALHSWRDRKNGDDSKNGICMHVYLNLQCT